MISRRTTLGLLAAAPSVLLPRKSAAQDSLPPIAKGPYDGTAEGLKKYKIPEWFRDAKFGMWAHWGPQSARRIRRLVRAQYLYSGQRSEQVSRAPRTAIPPSSATRTYAGLWKGDQFDPDHLMQLYKKAGAKYFMSMGVHHDNFDLWNSKHQPRWNAVAIGPKKDVVGLWRKAAQKYGLKFAVSEHLSNSYNWLAVSHGADKTGELAGVPYDGQDPAYADLYHPFPKDQPIPAQAMSRVAAGIRGSGGISCASRT